MKKINQFWAHLGRGGRGVGPSFPFFSCFSPVFSCFSSCSSVGHHLVFSEDQVERRMWWAVGQVLPSYQNRQISALDETADAPRSRLFFLLSTLSLSTLLSSLFSLLSLFPLFSFLSSLSSVHLSSINTYLSSPESGPLAGRLRVARGCSLGGSPFS